MTLDEFLSWQAVAKIIVLFVVLGICYGIGKEL